MDSRLKRLLEETGWGRTDEISERLEAYADLLVQHNKRHNLVGKLGREQILWDLIVDALLPALVVKPEGDLMDVGSGSGLPGIPLAVAFPERAVHLVEPRQKRVTFLSIASRKLGLANVTIYRRRIEALTELDQGSLGTMAAKAFRPPRDWLEEARRWASPGGLIYLYGSTTSWPEEAREGVLEMGLEELGRRRHPLREDRLGVAFRML